jgi:hypothetical protein
VALAAMVVGSADWGEAIGLPILDRLYHFPYFLAGVLAADRLRAGVVPRLGRPRAWLPLAGLWLVLAGGRTSSACSATPPSAAGPTPR